MDKYAQKMVNSEYSVEMTRQTIVGGLKGYERLLSLSKDHQNPKWKPLHLAAKWNSRNRRIAKQLSKTNWFKEKTEVDPSASSHQEDSKWSFSIHKDGKGPEVGHRIQEDPETETAADDQMDGKEDKNVGNKRY